MSIDVYLATSAELADGEPGGEVLIPALAQHGISAQWQVWTDPRASWNDAVTYVRSTWDYQHQIDRFLTWAARVPTLANGAGVFSWNCDKAYVIELGRHVATVPTRIVTREEEVQAGLADWGAVVIKPRIGAGGEHLQVIRSSAQVPAGDWVRAPGWVMQPVVESIATEGERSVFTFNGNAVSQVRKHTSGAELRVNEEYGGWLQPEPLEAAAQALAEATVAAAQRHYDCLLHYARVDMLMADTGELAVSELEAIEPGLYLDVEPDNADRFAMAVCQQLGRAHCEPTKGRIR